MDKDQEEMRSLGLFGVCKETYMLISSWKKIFNQITLALISPLTFIFLVDIGVSNFFSTKMIYIEAKLRKIHQYTPQYQNLSELLLSEIITLLIVKLVCLIFFTIASLFSTSAVAYAIASIYNGREPSFKKVMGAFPRVWKRLLVTILCANVSVLAYAAMGALFYLIWILAMGLRHDGFAIFWIIAVLYCVGVVYLTVIWDLANVISVLEDSYGFQAMIKSMKLIKGKLRLSMIVYLKFSFLFALLGILYIQFVVHGRSLGSMDKVTCSILFFLVVSMLLLFQLVIQTVIYFVCKSYHHENIDKLTLSDDHLEEHYVGEDAPLKATDVQFQQCDMI